MQMSVLIVEDDAVIAECSAQVLIHAGYRVLGPVSSVNTALALVETDKPDLALLNIDLGAGGDGTVLARELATKHAVQVLFLSGSVSRALDAQDVAVGYVCKPCNPDILVAAVGVAAAVANGLPPPPPPRDMVLFKSLGKT